MANHISSTRSSSRFLVSQEQTQLFKLDANALQTILTDQTHQLIRMKRMMSCKGPLLSTSSTWQVSTRRRSSLYMPLYLHVIFEPDSLRQHGMLALVSYVAPPPRPCSQIVWTAREIPGSHTPRPSQIHFPTYSIYPQPWQSNYLVTPT